MNDLQIFTNNELGQVRVVSKDGEPWFVAKDVCTVLDIQNATQALYRLDEDERSMLNIGRQGEANIINEYGLYNLILASRKPEAKKFKRWVTHEVLPSIRKHGIYAEDNVIEQILDNPQFGIDLLTKLKEERQKRIESEKKNNILMHVNKTYTATEIGKELGFKSAIVLNSELAKRRIQFKLNDTWVLYSDYAGRGYEQTKQEVLDNGNVVYHMRWTQLGREFLLKLFEKERENENEKAKVIRLFEG